MCRLGGLALLPVLFCSLLQGQKLEEPIQEFFVGQTVYPEERQEIQITLTPAFVRSQAFDENSFSWEIEYGVTDRFQLEIELPYSSVERDGLKAKGFGNLEVGALYSLLPGNQPFALAVSTEVALPSGDAEVVEQEAEWGSSVILAKAVGRAQIHLGLGVEVAEEESQFFYQIAGVLPLNPVFSLTLELNQTELIGEEKRYFTPGFYVRLPRLFELFEVGAGFPFSLGKPSENYGAVVKATLEF